MTLSGGTQREQATRTCGRGQRPRPGSQREQHQRQKLPAAVAEPDKRVDGSWMYADGPLCELDDRPQS